MGDLQLVTWFIGLNYFLMMIIIGSLVGCLIFMGVSDLFKYFLAMLAVSLIIFIATPSLQFLNIKRQIEIENICLEYPKIDVCLNGE